MTRGGGREIGQGKPSKSEEAPAFNTCQRDWTLPTLSQSEEESDNGTSSTSSNPTEARVVTSRPNPVEVETEATNVEAQIKVVDIETETEDTNLIRRKDTQIREAFRWKLDRVRENFIMGWHQ